MTVHDLIDELREAVRVQEFPEIMTTAQAAEFLGVSEYFMLEMRQRGTGPRYSRPAHKVIRYLRKDLVAWLDENAVE